MSESVGDCLLCVERVRERVSAFMSAVERVRERVSAFRSEHIACEFMFVRKCENS